MLSGVGYYQHEEDRLHYLLTDHLGNVRVAFAEIDSGTGEYISALLVMELRNNDGVMYDNTWSAVKVYEETDK